MGFHGNSLEDVAYLLKLPFFISPTRCLICVCVLCQWKRTSELPQFKFETLILLFSFVFYLLFHLDFSQNISLKIFECQMKIYFANVRFSSFRNGIIISSLGPTVIERDGLLCCSLPPPPSEIVFCHTCCFNLK